ncbi:MAG: hypothetical protein PUD02_01360 [Eggerthellales bacterium]|nr:hypothetical protein [Eggerthellales bacterium]
MMQRIGSCGQASRPMSRRVFSAGLAVATAGAALGLAGCGGPGGSDGDSADGAGSGDADGQSGAGSQGNAGAQDDSSSSGQVIQMPALGQNAVCVTEYANNALVVLDPTTGAVVERVTLGVNPAYLAQSADALAVTCTGSSQVAIVPLAGGPVAMAQVGTQPLGVCAGVGSSAGRFYVTDYNAGCIHGVDQALASVVGTAVLGGVGYQNRIEPPECCRRNDPTAQGRRPVSVACSPDGATVYAATYGTYDLAVVDVASMAETGQMDGTVGPRKVILSPDGSWAFLAGVGGESSERETDLIVMDLATQKRQARIPIGAGVAGVCQSIQDGVLFCTARDDGLVVRVEPDGDGAWAVTLDTQLGIGVESVALSADGSLLVVCNNQTGVVWGLDPVSLEVLWESEPLAAPKDALVISKG